MRDEIDHILKEKLVNGDPLTRLSGWDRLEKELIALDEKKKRRDKPFFIYRLSRYAALGLLVIGLGYFSYKYNVGVEKGDVVAKATENTTLDAESGSVSELAQNKLIQGSQHIVEDKNLGEDLVSTENLLPQIPEITGTNKSVETLGDYTGQSGKDQIMETSGELAATQSADIVENEIGYGRNIFVEPAFSPVISQGFSGFMIESPSVPLLFQERELEPILAETDRLDINQYLHEFDQLYGEEEPDDKKWWVTTTADVLSINSNYFGSSYGRDRSMFEKVGRFVRGLDINEYFDNEFYEYTGNLPYDHLCSGGGGLGVYVHDLPFSAGFSLNRDISDKFGIGTGIVLKKMWARAGYIRGSHYEQTIIYTGIPVTVYYQLLPKNSNWDFKFLVGLTADKAIFTEGKDCLSLWGKITEYPTSLKNPTEIMLTSNAGVGVGYKFAKGISIYAEPNFRYTFYSKGQPVTFFTDRLLGFVVRTGLKFEF